MDGQRLAAGQLTSFDLHLFDLSPQRLPQLEEAFARFAADGLTIPAGAELAKVEPLDLAGQRRALLFDGRPLDSPMPPLEQPVSGALPSGRPPVTGLRIRFASPTEIKGGNGFSAQSPQFGPLFARARDRVATLLRLCHGWQPSPDTAALFRHWGEAASNVRCVGHQLVAAKAGQRTSGRHGQTHTLGGVMGIVDYEGVDLSPFPPWLMAARRTGGGRQTVWGNGEFHLRPAAQAAAR